MLQHGTALLVALAYATIAFADGGYSTELIAAGAIAIWWIVIVGILAHWWRGGGGVPREAIVAGGMLAALAVWTALSLLWATDAGRAFAEVVRVAAYLGLFALVVIVSRGAGPRPVLNGLTGGLLIVGTASLATRLFLGIFETDDLQTFASLNSATGRLGFPIGYWNGLAACMAGLIVLLAWLSASAATAVRRSLAAAAIVVPILVIYLSSSRGGYLAAAAGVVLLVALDPRRRGRIAGAAVLAIAGGALLVWLTSLNSDLLNGYNTDSAQQAGWQLALATVAVALGIGVARALLEPRLLDRITLPRLSGGARIAIAALVVVVVVAGAFGLERQGYFEEFTAAPESGEVTGDVLRGSGSGRYQYWEAAVDAFRSEPLTGIGAGNFELWWNVHGTLPRKIVDAHSLYLETLGELGLVGFLLLAGFVATLVVALVRSVRTRISAEVAAAAGLVGAGLISAAIDWSWELPAVFGLVIVGAAVLTSNPGTPVRAVVEGEPTGGVEGGRSRRDGFGLGVAVMAAAWASICAAFVLFLTEVKLDDSREAEARGDLNGALQAAVDAGAVQPWSLEPLLQQARIELLRGDVPAAQSTIDDAAERAPEDFRIWILKARAEAAEGDAGGYETALARAERLVPIPIPPEAAPPP